MKAILIAATLSASALLAAMATPSYAQSACKGLEQSACTSNTACTWRAALVKGETQTKAGQPAKVNRKAHCAIKRVTTAKAKAA